MPRIQRTSDEGPLYTAGEAITNWPVGRIYPTPKRVPSGWNLFRLTAVARLESGHTPSRRVPKYWDDGVPWISLHDSDSLESSEISATAMTISQAGLDNSSARLLPKGTVVFSRTATVGKATIMGREMATSQDFANYVCGDQLDNRYLVYLFRFMEPEWKRLMAGSTHNSIYMPVFQEMAILLPPMCEQHRIADALSDVDALIESLEQLLAKKRQIKQGAMQDLLTGKKRLPGFHTEWKQKSLGTAIEALEAGISVNSTEETGTHESAEASILKTSCVNRGTFLPFECKRIVERDTRRAKLSPRANTILISRMNTIDLVGECGFVEEDYPQLFIPDRLWMTRFNKSNPVSARWLSYVLSTDISRDLLKSIATGTSGSMKNIGKEAFLSLELLFPTFEEQCAMASAFTDMDALLASIEDRLSKARQLKQGMMQELLTGRIRLV